MKKRCRACDKYKNTEDFPHDKRNTDRLSSYCRECKSKADAESRRKRKQRKRNKERFGLEMTDHDIQNLINNGAIKQ